MARTKLTESEIKGMVCTCQVCGNKFIDLTGTNNLMCPKCIEETVARHKNEQAKKCITAPKSILGNKPITPFHCPVKVPEKGTEKPSVLNPFIPTDEEWKEARERVFSYARGEKPTQQKIRDITEAMKDLLLYKNEKYGDSAISPLSIFTKHIKNVENNTASILVRLDDKLSRVKNAEELRTNDVSDIIGYCTLLLISMGVTKEDIEKFKD